MSKEKKIKFVRYGGLNSFKQTHYKPDSDPDKTFHNPPRKYGFFAMPHTYEELFLLGATDHPTHISGKSQWLKDDDGNLVKDDRVYNTEKNILDCSPELKKLLRKRGITEKQLRTDHKSPPIECKDYECSKCKNSEKCKERNASPLYLSVLKKPKVFDYTGEIWHHLTDDIRQDKILDRSGSWIKTTYNDYIECFNKHMHYVMRDGHKRDFSDDQEWNFEIKKRLNQNNPYRAAFPGFTESRDNLEVFIEKL